MVIFFAIFAEVVKKGETAVQRCAVRIAALKNFAKLMGKHWHWSPISRKVADSDSRSIKNRTSLQVFCCEIAIISRTVMLQKVSASEKACCCD